jgi:hypothetical protein
MSIISFIENHKVIDKIIAHLHLRTASPSSKGPTGTPNSSRRAWVIFFLNLKKKELDVRSKYDTIKRPEVKDEDFRRYKICDVPQS